MSERLRFYRPSSAPVSPSVPSTPSTPSAPPRLIPAPWMVIVLFAAAYALCLCALFLEGSWS